MLKTAALIHTSILTPSSCVIISPSYTEQVMCVGPRAYVQESCLSAHMRICICAQTYPHIWACICIITYICMFPSFPFCRNAPDGNNSNLHFQSWVWKFSFLTLHLHHRCCDLWLANLANPVVLKWYILPILIFTCVSVLFACPCLPSFNDNCKILAKGWPGNAWANCWGMRASGWFLWPPTHIPRMPDRTVGATCQSISQEETQSSLCLLCLLVTFEEPWWSTGAFGMSATVGFCFVFFFPHVRKARPETVSVRKFVSEVLKGIKCLFLYRIIRQMMARIKSGL